MFRLVFIYILYSTVQLYGTVADLVKWYSTCPVVCNWEMVPTLNSKRNYMLCFQASTQIL